MKKYHYFIYPIFLFFYIQIIQFYIHPAYEVFVDYGYYSSAVLRFWAGESIYQNNFVYLPSFFILTPIFLDIYIYLSFLLISLVISFIILIKLEDKFWMVFFVLCLPVLYSYNGNIDPFIFMILLICLYSHKKNEYLAPVLLAFISFKPNVIFILPYFIYVSKKKKIFILIYLIFLSILNFYFIIQFNVIFEYFDFIFFNWHQTHFMDYIRPYWLYYVYYFGLKEKSNKTEYIKSFQNENSINKSS